MSTTQSASIWDQWSKDFDAVEREVMTLAHARSVWDIISALRTAPGVVSEVQIDGYLIRTYVSTVSSGIRREADDRSDTTSLVRCLRNLSADHLIFTLDRFVELYRATDADADRQARARAAFRVFAPNGGACVEKTVVETSIRRIQKAAATVKKYTDEVVAHRSKSESLSTQMFSTFNLDTALDALGEEVQKYHGLRHPGEALGRVTPILDLSWALALK